MISSIPVGVLALQCIHPTPIAIEHTLQHHMGQSSIHLPLGTSWIVQMEEGKLPSWSIRPAGQRSRTQTTGSGSGKNIKEWYENGQLRIRRTCRDDKLFLYKMWYENGELWMEGTYRNGKLEGLYRRQY